MNSSSAAFIISSATAGKTLVLRRTLAPTGVCAGKGGISKRDGRKLPNLMQFQKNVCGVGRIKEIGITAKPTETQKTRAGRNEFSREGTTQVS